MQDISMNGIYTVRFRTTVLQRDGITNQITIVGNLKKKKTWILLTADLLSHTKPYPSEIGFTPTCCI